MRQAVSIFMANYKRQIQILLVVAFGVLVASVQLLTTGAGEAQAQEAFNCDKWASANGSDAHQGSEASPVRHIPKLISLLSPGETGCLKAGETFEEATGEFIVGNAGGSSDKPITIRSSEADRANIKAQMWLQTSSHDIVFKDLNFVDSTATAGNGSSMLIVHGDRITFEDNDIQFKRGQCFTLGQLNGDYDTTSRDPAEGLVLNRNLVHNCGVDLPLASSGEHGIYIQHTKDAKITNNYIYDHHVHGVQVYPKATGTVIENNVIDGSSGNVNIGAYWNNTGVVNYSSYTTLRNNIISNSTFAYATKDLGQVQGNYPSGTTETQYNNVVHDNCLYPVHDGEQSNSKNFAGLGFSHYDNVFGNPNYKNEAGGSGWDKRTGTPDFRLQDGSPCVGKGPAPGNEPLSGGSGDNPANGAPTITSVSPTDGSSTKDTTPEITAVVRDAETQLTEADIDLYLDGRKLTSDEYGYNQASYQGTHKVFHTPPDDKSLSLGTHTVKVVARDNQGTPAELTSSFSVTKDPVCVVKKKKKKKKIYCY